MGKTKNYIINKAIFLCSNTDYTKCPDPTYPEMALIGRSNVGKSTLINALCHQKKLAKVSSKPGKTQHINHFLVNDNWYLVDLPGYGWAKVSKTSRYQWQKMTRDYLLKRPNLSCVMVLIDACLPPQKIDIEFIHWLGTNQVPLTLIYTKRDKVKLQIFKNNKEQLIETLYRTWEALPPIFETSAKNPESLTELLNFISNVC